MVDVKTIIEESQEKMDMAVMYLEEALAHIRAGKASTRLLDHTPQASSGRNRGSEGYEQRQCNLPA